MAEQGITVLRWDQLDDHACQRLTQLFRAQVFPVLTPLAVDPAHPFPYISGLSLNLAVVVLNPSTGKQHFARVKVPPVLPRFLRVPHTDGDDDDRAAFVPLEDVIAAHLSMLFPGMDVVRHSTFRVTRNEDLEVEEDDAENLLQALEKELLRRRFGPPVRLELADDTADDDADLLLRELGVVPEEVYRLPEPLDLRGLTIMADLDRPELSYPKFLPRTHRDLNEVETAQASNVFAAISRRDVLLHHPYDSFSTVRPGVPGAVGRRPHVLAIKQTLYRTSGDSPIVDALIDAAEAGKQVLALVEIKARFDEQANITWARKLEHAGVHVVYGIVGLKTHAKLSLVVRQEPGGLARYCHVGTGNYNPKTARIYEDLGLLTRTRRWPTTSRCCSTSCPASPREPRTSGCSWLPGPSVRVWWTSSSGRSSTPAGGSRRASGSRSTPSSTRPSSTPSTGPRTRACRWTSWSAASARSGPACPG
jgi:polyphosphate kinase